MKNDLALLASYLAAGSLIALSFLFWWPLIVYSWTYWTR